jgi:hypothetical protein
MRAEVTIDGKRVGYSPTRIRVPRSPRPVPILVEADGHEQARIEAVPDRDHFLIVPMLATQPEAASSAPAPSASAPAEPRAEASQRGPAKHPPATPGRGGAGGRKPPKLVTDYPF